MATDRLGRGRGAAVHVTGLGDWTAALDAGRYDVSTRGARLDEIGFIHCSTPEQLAEVAAFVYADVADDLVVLELDDDTVRATGTVVRYEDGGNGTCYPHIYGAIDPTWVQAVRRAWFDRQGGFHWERE